MNDFNEINDNINELIMSKSFDRLNDEEKRQALEYAGSEGQYNQLRQTLLAITSSFSGEADEDFAEADIKNDLMSQFEKKYGTQGGRSKVVPLYRKPYFQLAVAASLALLIFFAVPVFRHNEQPDTNGLAMTHKPASKTMPSPHAADENTAVSVAESGHENNRVVPAENNPPVQSGNLQDDKSANTKEQKADLELSPERKVVADKMRNETEVDDISSSSEKSLAETNNTLLYTPPPPVVSNTLSDKDAVALEEKREEAKSKKTAKDAPDLNYRTPSGDHTHHHAERMDEMAAGAASTVPSKNIVNALGYVEQNKTQMIDMLFTVY